MIIEVKDVQSGYGKFHVLHGVNISVKSGSIVALIGPNGAGKSTVLKSIFGMTTHYSGSIKFNGVDITKVNTSSLVAKGLSFVPQGRLVFSSLSVEENLEMGAYLVKDSSIVLNRLEKVYSRFPVLREKKDDYAFSLSGGQQQMLAIGRALMQDPKVLMLDEPSLGLSPKLMKEMFSKIIEISKEGVTILIVEQNAKQAIAISDQTYVLEDGKIGLVGGKDIVKNPMIKKIYLGGR